MGGGGWREIKRILRERSVFFGREVKGEMPKKHYLFSQHCRDASRSFINIHLSRLEAMSVFCTV